MNPFKSPIEWLTDLLKQLIDAIADAAWHWLEIYLLKPTSFEKGYVGTMSEWMIPLAIALCSLFLSYNVIKFYFNGFSGNVSRSASEIVVKSFLGVALACGAPIIMTQCLLKLNNVYCKALLKQGIDTDRFSDFILNPLTSNIAITFASFVIVVLYLILAIQYVIRQAELAILFIGAPIAGITIVNEEMNIWPIWWREVISTIFTQAFQLTVLSLILNQIGNGKNLNELILACGLIIVLIVGPKYLRTFIYSSGAGKSVVGAANGVGKIAIMKYAASRITKVPMAK